VRRSLPANWRGTYPSRRRAARSVRGFYTLAGDVVLRGRIAAAIAPSRDAGSGGQVRKADVASPG